MATAAAVTCVSWTKACTGSCRRPLGPRVGWLLGGGRWRLGRKPVPPLGSQHTLGAPLRPPSTPARSGAPLAPPSTALASSRIPPLSPGSSVSSRQILGFLALPPPHPAQPAVLSDPPACLPACLPSPGFLLPPPRLHLRSPASCCSSSSSFPEPEKWPYLGLASPASSTTSLSLFPAYTSCFSAHPFVCLF